MSAVIISKSPFEERGLCPINFAIIITKSEVKLEIVKEKGGKKSFSFFVFVELKKG